MKMIQVSDELHSWLVKQGKKNETFEDIIKRLIKEVRE